jgi:hypothetical protein
VWIRESGCHVLNGEIIRRVLLMSSIGTEVVTSALQEPMAVAFQYLPSDARPSSDSQEARPSSDEVRPDGDSTKEAAESLPTIKVIEDYDVAHLLD